MSPPLELASSRLGESTSLRDERDGHGGLSVVQIYPCTQLSYPPCSDHRRYLTYLCHDPVSSIAERLRCIGCLLTVLSRLAEKRTQPLVGLQGRWAGLLRLEFARSSDEPTFDNVPSIFSRRMTRRRQICKRSGVVNARGFHCGR